MSVVVLVVSFVDVCFVPIVLPVEVTLVALLEVEAVIIFKIVLE